MKWKELQDLMKDGSVTVSRVETKVTQKFSILPDDGPLLKIEEIAEDGRTVSACTMNLSAVDDFIGKLIKMRDLMAAMKGSGE